MSNQHKDIPISLLKDNPVLLDQFSQCLDREFPHIKYWVHFAHVMEVNNKVISLCKLRSDKSPTVKLFDHLKATRPQLTIKELISALSDTGRNDLCHMIRIFDDKDKVSEVITHSSSEMMDNIALELDSARRPIGNWRNLAQKLELARNVYEKFEMYSDWNPTVSLVRYLYAASEKPIPLKRFVDVLKEMDRQDAVDEITKVTGSDAEELRANNILKLGSDLLEKVAELLNNERLYLKGWRELGRGFSVDPSIIQSLEIGPHYMEVLSPTTRIIKHLAADKPSTTITDIVRALEKIKRNDAIKILRSHFSIDVRYDRGNIEDLGITPDPHGLAETYHDDVNRACATSTNITPYGIQATEPTKKIVFEEDANRNFGVTSKTIEIIGRMDEKRELLTSLTDGQYQMVVLRAAKGYGKTTLVVNVAHEIIEDPYCYTVVYVDSKNVFSLTDLAYKILKTCGISSSQNCPVSQVIDLFSHSHKNCVLILENLDHMYHSIDKMNQTSSSQTGSNADDDFHWQTTDIFSKRKEFQCFLKDIIKSAPKLKILVTTWKSVAFVTIKVKQMTLNTLNEEEALELLRSRSDMPLEDEEALEPIIRCCGGIPLLLCSAAAVLSEQGMAAGVTLASSPPEKPLNNLSQDSLPEEERLDQFRGICFERMTVCSREVLVLLSVFPSTFTLEEAKHIAKAGGIDDDQLEEGFQALKAFGFLTDNDLEAKTYILYQAVRSFGILKAREEGELEKLFKAARWGFISYTFGILIEVEDEFFSTQSRSAIQRYRSQDENIREIAQWCTTDSNMDIKVKQFCIQSFISSQYVLLKIMRSHPLKQILCKFARFCQKSDNSKLYCECLIMGGAKIVIGCLCTPYICYTALKQADRCFLKVFKALANKNSTRTTDTTVQDLASFEVLQTICSSDVLSDTAKANFLIKCGKCLVRYGNQELGFYYIQNGIRIRSMCFKDSPDGKVRVMVAIGCNDLADARTYVRQHTDAVLLRKEYVLPIYEKELGMHPFTATAYSQLARNYLELGEYDKAIQANDIALRYRQVLLGDHQETARSLFDKGAILAERASTHADAEKSSALREEALLHLQKALAMQKRKLNTPKETAKTHQELAVVLYQLGRNEESEQQMDKIAKCVKEMEIYDDCPCLPKSASPSVEEIAVESAVKREDATSNQTDDLAACSSTREGVKKSWFSGVKEYFKQKLGLNSRETGASTQDGNNIDGYFEKYENFALDYQHRVFLSDIKDIMRLELSIGAIITVNISNVKTCAGTCFRIGTRYVITNKHVIDEINKYGILLCNCYVDFNYHEQGPADLRFRFAPSPVLVTSDIEELDYAILELHPDDKREFPPSVIGSGFNIAPAGRKLKSEDSFTLIGHPERAKKQMNVSCPIKDQDDIEQHLGQAQSKLNETEFASHLFYIQNAWSRPHVATYDVSTFFWGSSGSPGFLLNEKLLVVLHTGGIPFEGYRKNHVLEYGILMSSISEDVKSKINVGEIQHVPISDIFDESNASPMDIDHHVAGL